MIMASKRTVMGVPAEQKTRNDLELAAWNEWKEVCCILGCSDSHREALKDRMWTSALSKLGTLLESAFPEWKDEFSEDGWKDEISGRFDAYIREGEADHADHAGKRLNYKDTIWNIIAENRQQGNDESPLKVIRGKLTAPKRVLDGVLEKLVKEKGWTFKILDHQLLRVGSLNEELPGHSEDGDDACERIGQIRAEDSLRVVYAAIPKDDCAFIRETLRDQFSFVECAVLYAYFKGITCDSPVLSAVTGCKREANSKLLYGRKAKAGKGKDCPGVLDKFKQELKCVYEIAQDTGWSGLMPIVLQALSCKLMTEKRGCQFLSTLATI